MNMNQNFSPFSNKVNKSMAWAWFFSITIFTLIGFQNRQISKSFCPCKLNFTLCKFVSLVPKDKRHFSFSNKMTPLYPITQSEVELHSNNEDLTIVIRNKLQSGNFELSIVHVIMLDFSSVQTSRSTHFQVFSRIYSVNVWRDGLFWL